MRVFNADKRNGRRMKIPFAYAFPYGFALKDPAGSGKGPCLYGGYYRSGAGLVLYDVAFFAQQHFRSPAAPGKKGKLVSESSRWYKDRRFFSRNFSAQFFEPVYRWIIPVYIVAYFGGRHCFPHCFCGLRYRITAYIDHRRSFSYQIELFRSGYFARRP
jgi:hypothetical protein